MVVKIKNELLKQKLQQSDITLTQIAEKTGLSTSHISFVINGHRNPSIRTLALIAHILGVNLNDLIIVEKE